RKNAIIRVFEFRGKVIEFFARGWKELWVAGDEQIALDTLWRRFLHHCVMDQATGEVALFDTRPSPVNDFCRQNTPDAPLLAQSKEYDVNARRINIREFGDITDSHHDLGLRKFAAH